MSECKFRGYIRKAKTFMCARNGIDGAHGCPDYHVIDCKLKQDGEFMGWKQTAKEDLSGRFIKFNAETPEWVVTFEGEPERVEAKSNFKKGDTYTVYEFPVSVNGKSKIMGVSALGLMNLLIEEDNEESLVGRTFKIKSLGEGAKRQWKIREIVPEKEVTQEEISREEFSKKVAEHAKKTRKAKESTIDPDEKNKGLVDLGSSKEEMNDGEE